MHNFITKFCQLWRDSTTANLHVETHAGMAWCQVRAQLGRAPAPADRRPQAQRQPGLRRRRRPAHERCKAQRAAARTAAAYESVAGEVTGSVTEQVMAESVTEQVAEAVTEQVAESGTKQVAVTESIAEEVAETIAEEASETIAEKAAETIA